MENTNDASSLLVPDVNEDSVDIYDDLDVISINGEKSPQDAFELKDSMDLYEEIVTEEQRNRESSFAELKSRFNAAQNQIKELRRRLEEMEIQNTKLNTENCSLKKNISALFRTAKQEVTRKDAEIQRLNQWSIKGHQFYTNNLQDQNFSSSRPLTSSPPPPPTSPSPLTTSSPRENHPPRDPPQHSKEESNNYINQPTSSCSDTRTSKQSSNCHLKNEFKFENESDKYKSKHRDEKYQSHKLSQSADWRNRTGSDSNKVCHAPNKTKFHKVDKDTGRKYDSRSCISKTYINSEGHHRLDRAKSPHQENFNNTLLSIGTTGRSQERRQDKAKLVTSDYERSKAHSSKERYSRDNRKSYSRSLNSKDRIKYSSNQNLDKYRDSSRDREGERLSKEYQKKVERRREDEVNRKHIRNSQSETSRERQKQRAKELNQGEVDVCSKENQENKHEALKKSSKEGNTTEKRSVEENAPNKKLCFMETLNLKLSPIKKPTISRSQDDPPVDKVVENQHDDENSQPNVEDMCIIDEIGSSQLEDVAEQTSDISESIAKSFAFVKDVQKEDTNCSKSEAEKPLDDNYVKSTLAHSQFLDMVQNSMTLNPRPESPQRNISQNHDNSNDLASESQIDKSGPLESTDSLSDATTNLSKQHTSCSSHQGKGQPVDEHFVPESKEELPNATVQTSFPVDLIEDCAVGSPLRESPVAEDVSGSPKIQHMPSPLLPQSCQHGRSPPALFSSVFKKEVCDMQRDPKETEAVSSTIGLELFPQEGLSLPEAIHILTQTTKDVNDSLATKPSSFTSCIGVSKVSSTTEELILPNRYSELHFTPKKNFSPVKSHENNVAPSSSVSLLHDEDSMMHTLSNLKRFPDAISPLKSPIRITKRSHLHVHVNPGQVKILQTDFSNTTVDVNSKKLEVNKENKYPGSPSNSDMQNMVDKATDYLSCLSDTELEEGEILSESEEASPDSPGPTAKRAKLSLPVRSKSSYKTVLKRKSEERHLVSKETPGTSTQSPKTRFKTVCPAASKVSFSSIDEIMETFKLVRSEIRKKYMKLHKSFPKKSFYGMMDNFQESFLEFVDGAQFGQICSQAGELKSRLKKLIACIFSKVSNNGIVQRIFEQQATDLKQKLWDFVDVQVDYLFKDIHTTLKNLCNPLSTQTKDMRPNGNKNMFSQPSVEKPQCQKEFRSAAPSLSQIKTSAVTPYRTGLGSRGKDIRITQVEKATVSNPCPVDSQTATDILPTKRIHSTPEKNNMVSLIVSQNGCLLDKTDFEILTEQQTSSLTFNLVRDSQMGEIFKCLLQGSDLLESSGITEDSTAWPLNTPRKDAERLISITTPTKLVSPSKLLYPNKLDTPSKLITTWSSISPLKMSSPRSKDPVKLNPALFDESCLLEVPSDNRLLLQSSMLPQKSYSILTEDLAVSLTIPSPLKSDSHLSFLQPSCMHVMSTPDSVISAHISEDALLDGEDATEQDIHLILDTDNSSCGSSSSVASMACSTSFMFQPDKPMQALVMEKSNDHFIVKIRQADVTDVTLTTDDSLSKTIREEDEQNGEEDMDQVIHNDSQAKATLLNKSQTCSSSSDAILSVLSNFSESSGMCQSIFGSDICLTQEKSLTLTKDSSCQKEETLAQQSTSKVCFSEESQSLKNHSSYTTLHTGDQCFDSVSMQFSKITNEKGVTLASNEYSTDIHHGEENTQTQNNSSNGLVSASNTVVSFNIPQPAGNFKNNPSKTSPSQCSDLEREEIEASESERSLVIAEDMSSTAEMDKRGCDKGRKRKKHREKSKTKRCRKEEEKTEEFLSKKDDNESNSFPASFSPNNLSAKNVVKKKGEVVMAWTRDEDRAILIDLKTKGPSRETFSALSEKLKKPSGQIAHRFYQLMKLFKKQEKTDTS